MKAFVTGILLTDLENDIRKLLADVKEIAATDNTATLMQQPGQGKWSVAQCIEHLNSYNRYYLPQIEKALIRGTYKNLPAATTYKPGWLGNYFTKLMKPGANGELSGKMNAPKDHRPPDTLDAKNVILEFIAEEERLLSYLQRARVLNIAKLKVPVSIAKFIKLQLGDTFRFLVAHQQRHMLQAIRAYHAVKKESAVNV